MLKCGQVDRAGRESKLLHDRIGTELNALAHAIAGGHDEFLLNLEGFTWKLVRAFAEAVNRNQTTLAKRMLGAYSADENIFIRLVREGYTDAVKYLHEKTFKDRKIVSTAFVAAAIHGNTAPGGIHLDTVQYLYNERRASAEAINKAFEATSSIDIIQLLYEKEHISAIQSSQLSRMQAKHTVTAPTNAKL
ncbi:unnamed protein product [Phytophthora lilii]|uniref:Unnamed protein product n=1 Tax=Phytophthora lilii TaxID=2077276 RepID=A0A9W7CLG7_9STRA|nr:unnamed protein product [Phytophthora lilii]